MDYPSILISNRLEPKMFSDDREIIEFGGFSVIYDKDIKEKITILNTENYNIFGHINLSFRQKILEMGNDLEQFVQDQNKIGNDFNWGFIAFFGKKNQDLVLINDFYGIYPLYYSLNGGKLIISNDFDFLAFQLSSLSINDFAVYDYLLFNYTLKSRTIFREISQIEGSSRYVFDINLCETNTSAGLEELFKLPATEVSLAGMCRSLAKNISNNLDQSLPSLVALTGGFDSKVIISALLSEGVEFKTFTFGIENSPDHIAAAETSRFLKLSHKYVAIPQGFLADFQSQLDRFLRNHANLPMFDTLLYYLAIKDDLPESNFITGQMGGELIVGPVLISELITTRSFASLAMETDLIKLEKSLISQIDQIGFLNKNSFCKNPGEYVLTLQSYMNRPGPDKNLNIVNFLLKETYAKFFGAVFSNLFSKFNIINPMVDIDYLQYLFNSEYRFTNKKIFRKAPLSHFISRRLYPRLVKFMQPAVLKTSMDRGYNLGDFLHWVNFYKPFINYAKRHLFKRSYTRRTGSALYLEMIKKMALELLPSSYVLGINIFDKQKVLDEISKMRTGNLSRFQEQKILQLFTLHLVIERYSDKIKGINFKNQPVS